MSGESAEDMDYEPSMDPEDLSQAAASQQEQDTGHDTTDQQAEQGLGYTDALQDDSEDKDAENEWIKQNDSIARVDTGPKAKKGRGHGRGKWSTRDTDAYRKGYPDKKGSVGTKNAEFYQNKRRCQPDDILIDAIHSEWWGDHRALEYKHGYIQWLFPIKEKGLNWEAQELNDEEIKIILADPKAHERILTSFKMMLDFYGMELVIEKSGEITYKRGRLWRERFAHLNYSMHNYMRITRILKCLGEFEYERLKAPFLKFVLREAIEMRTLSRTLDSCRNYWIQVLKDDKERDDVIACYELLHKQSPAASKYSLRSKGALR